MNKKLLFIAAIAFTSQLFSEVNIDKVEEAIEKSHIATVKAALTKLKHDSLSLAEKKKYLENFYDSAAELVDTRKESLSLTGNWKDVAKTTFGTLFILTGLAGVGFSFILADRNHRYGPHAVERLRKASGVIALLGLPILYKGLTCSSQKAVIKKAEEVEQIVETAYNEVEALMSQIK